MSLRMTLGCGSNAVVLEESLGGGGSITLIGNGGNAYLSNHQMRELAAAATAIAALGADRASRGPE